MTATKTEVFHLILNAIPQREGWGILVQTNDVDGWSDLTWTEAMNSRNSPHGLNGVTRVYYVKDDEPESELIVTVEFPYSFDRRLADEGEEE